MFAVNKNPSRADLRKFGLAMLLGFATIAALVYVLSVWRDGDAAVLRWNASTLQIIAMVLVALGAAVFALGIAAPSAARHLYVLWMTVAMALGAVMSTVLLTVLFLVLLPIFAVVVRLSDPLRRKLSRSPSYWEDYKPYEATLERMKRTF